MKRIGTLIAAAAILGGTGSAWAMNNGAVQRTVKDVDMQTHAVVMDDNKVYAVPDRAMLRELRPGDTYFIKTQLSRSGMPVITELEPTDIHWIGAPPGFG